MRSRNGISRKMSTRPVHKHMIEKIKMMLMWKILAIPTAIHMRIDKIPVH